MARPAANHSRIATRPQHQGDQRCLVRWLTYLIGGQCTPIRKGCVKSERMQAVGTHRGCGALGLPEGSVNNERPG